MIEQFIKESFILSFIDMKENWRIMEKDVEEITSDKVQEVKINNYGT